MTFGIGGACLTSEISDFVQYTKFLKKRVDAEVQVEPFRILNFRIRVCVLNDVVREIRLIKYIINKKMFLIETGEDALNLIRLDRI